MYVSVWLFICFALGIVCGNFFSLNFFFLIVLAGFSSALAVIFYKRQELAASDASILFFFFLLGFIWIKPYTVVLPEEVLTGEVAVYGKVEGPPREFTNFRTYAIGSNYVVRGGEKIYYPGAIFVKDYSQQDISYLDFYLFKGKLRKSRYGNSRYTLYVSGKNPPSPVKKSVGLRKLAFMASEKIASIIESNFSKEITPFILSIFLGEREELSKEIKDIFANAGTSHILAISGLHIGIVAGLILSVLKIFRLRLTSRYIIAIPLVFFYVFICGLRSPTLRAGIMFSCFSLSFLMRRKFLIFNSLALAGLINLFLRPDDLFTISFQFSFIAVFFIALGFQHFHAKSRNLNFFEKIKILFFMSLFANMGLAPLVSFYFGRIYFFNLFTNILIIPYLGVIFSSLFIFFGMYFIVPLRAVLSASCSFLIVLFLKINYFSSALPFSYFKYRFSMAGILLYYGILLTLAFLIRSYFLKYLGKLLKKTLSGRQSRP